MSAEEAASAAAAAAAAATAADAAGAGAGAGVDAGATAGGDVAGEEDVSFPVTGKAQLSGSAANPQSAAANFATEVGGLKRWSELAFASSESAFAHTEAVKLIIDVRPKKDRVLRNLEDFDEDKEAIRSTLVESDDCRCYFLQTATWTWHFPFAKRHLLSRLAALNPMAHERFNTHEYNSEDRDFMLVSLTRYADHGGIVCFEQWPGDTLSGERVALYLTRVAALLGDDLPLCYRPMSPKQEETVVPAVQALGIRVVDSAELFGDISYQPLTLGAGVGRLRFLTCDRLSARGTVVKPWDILVLDSVSNDLPVCAGLITSVVQSPLCHTALLCQNRSTPNMALVGIFDDKPPSSASAAAGEGSDGGAAGSSGAGAARDKARRDELRTLDKKWVRLNVSQQDYTFKEVSKDEAMAVFLDAEEKRRATASFVLEKNVDVTGIVPIGSKALTSAQRAAVGAKASQFSELTSMDWGRRVNRYLVQSRACAIPFSAYDAYARAVGAAELIDGVVEAAAAASAQTHVDMASSAYLAAGEDPEDVDDDDDSLPQLPPGALLTASLRLYDNNNNNSSSNTTTSSSSASAGKGGAVDGTADSAASAAAVAPSTAFAATTEGLCDALCQRLVESSDHAVLDPVCDELFATFRAWRDQDGEESLAAGVILRSSTNVEDLPGFNGAGLYESLPLTAAQMFDRKQVKQVIARVYASLWVYRGFAERTIFNIDHTMAAMALLVQPYAQDVKANGVGLSLIPSRPGFPGSFLNVQFGDAKVTDGVGRPEQIVVYAEGLGVPEIQARSSMGGAVLTAREAVHLHAIMQMLHRKYVKYQDVPHNSVDVEFVIVGEKRKVMLLQCRPCSYALPKADDDDDDDDDSSSGDDGF